MPNLLLTMWDTLNSSNIGILVAAGLGMFAVISGLAMLSYHYTLGSIKSRTVGDGQHGTARWATDKEIRQTYAHVPFKVRDWRKGVSLPTEQGLVLGCKGKKGELTALVDSDDIHCLMIAASGAGKTAFFLYPNLEYACASGMSFLALDTKGDLARNYGSIAKKYYGYKNISVIDLRNPTRSDGNNLLTLINRYMDIARKQPDNLAARAILNHSKKLQNHHDNFLKILNVPMPLDLKNYLIKNNIPADHYDQHDHAADESDSIQIAQHCK